MSPLVLLSLLPSHPIPCYSILFFVIEIFVWFEIPDFLSMLAFNLCECVWSFALQLLQINFLISRNCEAFYYCRAMKTSWHINLRGWFVNYRNEMWKKKLTKLINRRTTMHIAKTLFSLVATICTHTVNLLVTLRKEREEKVKPLFIISTYIHWLV